MYNTHYPDFGYVHLHFENLQVVRVSESPPYSGEYTVVPGPERTVLHVKGMLMSNDIEVEPIPQYEVDNPAGGITFVIGAKQNG